MISAAAFVLACIAAFITGWVVSGVTNFTPRSLPQPAPPPSLAEHVDTFREIVSASGEMTPEVEAWLGHVSQEQKALPGLSQHELYVRHCLDEDDDIDACVDNWNQILADLALESVEEDKVEALRSWVSIGQRFTDYEYVQIVSMFTKAENRKAVRNIMNQPKSSSEADAEVAPTPMIVG